MKKSLLLLSGLIGACSGTAGDGQALVGDWVRTDGALSCETSFHQDGTFGGSCANQGMATWTFAGNWSVRGDVLSYEYKESSLKQIPPGTKDADKLVALASDHYVVKSRDGVQRQYQRSTK